MRTRDTYHVCPATRSIPDRGPAFPTLGQALAWARSTTAAYRLTLAVWRVDPKGVERLQVVRHHERSNPHA